MVGFEAHSQDGALPFSNVTGLLAAASQAEKQQALGARIFVPLPPPSSDPSTSNSLDHFAKLSSIAAQLCDYIQKHARRSDYLDGQDYIWHREPPSISVVSPPSSSRPSSSSSTTQQQQQPPHILLHLRTGGECIEDEWFATHLLIRASTHFAQHQLCISVEDEDGHFLLIEAAEFLPEWVTPETVSNRVWIFDGHLHLVPPHYTTSQDGALAARRAVELVTDTSILTRASDDIEAAAFARAYEFPSAAAPHHHRTLAYLPRRIANVLAAEPQLIANCVASIQSRDVVSSRSGSRLVHFPPPPPPSQASNASTSNAASTAYDENKVVLTSVRMTRHLYAQLLHDRFFPPRQLGPQWQAAVEKYRLRLFRQSSSAPTQAKIEDEAEVQLEMQHGRWHDLGAKIWCGLEMLYTESLSRRTTAKARPMAASQSPLPAQEREKLIESLTKLGYFQGEIEGSAKWKQLETEAVTQYLKASSGLDDDSKAKAEDALLCDTVDRILQASSSSSLHPTILPPDAAAELLKAAEDDDSWLQLGADDIESILQTKAGSADDASRAINEQDAFKRLGAFNSKMEDFIKTKSDVRGAVFEDELDDEDMQLDDDDLLFEELDEQEQQEKIKSEVRERMRSGGEEEKRKLVERLIPRMSEQEWTRKPTRAANRDPIDDGGQGAGSQDFLSSIDRIAAARHASAAQQQEPQVKDVATRADNHLSAAHAELRRRLASHYMRETSTLLSSQRHHQFDGASDSDDEELEQETSPEIRRQRAKEYDIEPDEVESAAVEAEAEAGWEDVGEPEELDEETEVDNLLEFARISLGLTKEQYQEILDERQRKGKFVPAAATQRDTSTKAAAPAPAPKLDTFESVMSAMEDQLHHLQSTPTSIPAAAPTSSDPPSSDAEDEELLAHLLRSGSDLPASLLEHLGDPDHADSGRAEQMESFLRSFQAQAATSGPGAGSGPVDVLMRRFGLGGLPADRDPAQ
ncbi:related to SGT1 protein [Sporisorium reilianum SRZ2]|uniref:Related to SGT1 protein n=1 Tax=Sporisorium reilianum (strain SRZ2) TaxID=999809 RepID=E6ZKA7_SPORE|nr:related to SGT1 protein [Sporisorium reilianum SRZ2]